MRYRKVLHRLFFIGVVTFPIYERTESSVQIGNICPKKYEEKNSLKNSDEKYIMVRKGKFKFGKKIKNKK